MSLITKPYDSDILCGKDKTFNKHPGNRAYRELIEEHAVSYSNESSKQIKMKVTKQIVQQLEASGARFIRKVGENAWQEISNQQARDKTSHALRFCAGSHIGHHKTPTLRSKRAKRTHRRIVSNDLNIPDYPFSSQHTTMTALYHSQEEKHVAIVEPLGSSSLSVSAYGYHRVLSPIEEKDSDEHYQQFCHQHEKEHHHIVPDQVVSSYTDLDDILQEPLGSIRDDSWDHFFPQV